MEKLVFLAVSLVFGATALFYIIRRGLTFIPLKKKLLGAVSEETEEKEGGGTSATKKTAPYNKAQTIALGITAALTAFAVCESFYHIFMNSYLPSGIAADKALLVFVKLFLLLWIVMCAAIVDHKSYIVPNNLIFTGLIFRAAIWIFELIICTPSECLSILKSDLIAFAAGFGILLIISIATKQGIGFGDVKLFGIIGIMSNYYCVVSVIISSSLVSVIIFSVLIISKKKGRKDAISFAPCILAGMLLTLLLGSY